MPFCRFFGPGDSLMMVFFSSSPARCVSPPHANALWENPSHDPCERASSGRPAPRERLPEPLHVRVPCVHRLVRLCVTKPHQSILKTDWMPTRVVLFSVCCLAFPVSYPHSLFAAVRSRRSSQGAPPPPPWMVPPGLRPWLPYVVLHSFCPLPVRTVMWCALLSVVTRFVAFPSPVASQVKCFSGPPRLVCSLRCCELTLPAPPRFHHDSPLGSLVCRPTGSQRSTCR
jgi:hypothetical protein